MVELRFYGIIFSAGDSLPVKERREEKAEVRSEKADSEIPQTDGIQFMLYG